jgi:hypothetical protein
MSPGGSLSGDWHSVVLVDGEAVPWGWGCIAVGVAVKRGWECPCGYRPRSRGWTGMQRPSGLVVCLDCARYLWESHDRLQ